MILFKTRVQHFLTLYFHEDTKYSANLPPDNFKRKNFAITRINKSKNQNQVYITSNSHEQEALLRKYLVIRRF